MTNSDVITYMNGLTASGWRSWATDAALNYTSSWASRFSMTLEQIAARNNLPEAYKWLFQFICERNARELEAGHVGNFSGFNVADSDLTSVTGHIDVTLLVGGGVEFSYWESNP